MCDVLFARLRTVRAAIRLAKEGGADERPAAFDRGERVAVERGTRSVFSTSEELSEFLGDQRVPVGVEVNVRLPVAVDLLRFEHWPHVDDLDAPLLREGQVFVRELPRDPKLGWGEPQSFDRGGEQIRQPTSLDITDRWQVDEDKFDAILLA